MKFNTFYLLVTLLSLTLRCLAMKCLFYISNWKWQMSFTISVAQLFNFFLTLASEESYSTCNWRIAPLTPRGPNASWEYSFSCNVHGWPRLQTLFIWKVKQWSGAGMIVSAAEVNTDIICRQANVTSGHERRNIQIILYKCDPSLPHFFRHWYNFLASSVYGKWVGMHDCYQHFMCWVFSEESSQY